jgi:hypothetical protein
MIDVKVGLALFLGLTVATLVLVVVTGLKARVRSHIALVITALVFLGCAIYFAVQVGRLYDLKSAGLITPIHLTVAKLATAAYLLPLISGLATLRDRKHKPLHFKLALVALSLTAIAAVTGSLMLWMASPLPL